MSLNFDDPNCRIDDSTPVPKDTHHRILTDSVKDLVSKVGKDNEKLVKLPHFDRIKYSDPIARYKENELFVETSVLEDFRCPKEVKEIFAQINQLRGSPIYCHSVKGVGLLKCDREKSKRNHQGQKNEIKKYLRAAWYFLDLLRLKTREIVVVEPEQQERLAQFKKNYRIQILWIEYYLLENDEVLIELGEKKRPTERQYRPGKISAMLHRVIEDIWALAENKKHPSCQWILSFDCPSQVWFILEVILILKEWKTPLKSGLQLYKLEMLHLKLLEELRKEDYKKITEGLLHFYNEKKTLVLNEALTFTFNQLRELGVKLSHEDDVFKARRAHANRIRKSEIDKLYSQPDCLVAPLVTS